MLMTAVRLGVSMVQENCCCSVFVRGWALLRAGRWGLREGDGRRSEGSCGSVLLRRMVGR